MVLKVKLLTLAVASGIHFVSNAAEDINLSFQRQIASSGKTHSSLSEYVSAENGSRLGHNLKTRSCLSDPNKCKS